MSARKMHVRKEDRVVVINGKDRGKTGRVLAVFPDANTVLVERTNLASHHDKRRDMRQQGGVIEREAPIHASNVMLICPTCKSQTRTYRKKLETGARIRMCRKCQEVIESQ